LFQECACWITSSTSKYGDEFGADMVKVMDHNIILKVYGIEKIKSYARPDQQEVLVKKGWKVELYNEKNRK